MTDNYYCYFFKHTKNFTTNETALYIREREHGNDMFIFYQVLVEMSLETRGTLMQTIGRRKQPYTIERLARLTGIDLPIAEQALHLLTDIGLIEVDDDGTMFLPDVEEMTQSETKHAQQKREYRAKVKNNETKEPENETTKIRIGQCPDNVRESIELEYRSKSIELEPKPEAEAEKPEAEPKETTETTTEIKKESESETSIEDGKDTANSKPETTETTDNKNDLVGMILSTGKELGEYKEIAERIASEYGEMNSMLIFRAIYKAKEAEKPSWRYAIKILQNWKRAGITTLEQQEIDQKQHDRRNQYSKALTATSATPKWSNSNENWKENLKGFGVGAPIAKFDENERTITMEETDRLLQGKRPEARAC